MTMTDQDFEQGEKLEEPLFRQTHEATVHHRLKEVSDKLYRRYYGTDEETEIPFAD